jgi:hypothetical protein
LYCPVQQEGGLLVFRESAEIWPNSTLGFWCIRISIIGGVRRFVLMGMMMEKGDVTDMLGLFQIIVPCSQFLYIVL